MQNNEIVIKDKIKYLGITLDKYLTYKAHDDEATSKAIWCGRALYPLLNRKSRLSEKNKLLLYKVCMRPLLSYGCPYKKRLQIIQNKNLKIIHNLPFRYSTSDLHIQFKHKTIETVLDDFTFTFNEKCRRATYAHLRNLI